MRRRKLRWIRELKSTSLLMLLMLLLSVQLRWIPEWIHRWVNRWWRMRRIWRPKRGAHVHVLSVLLFHSGERRVYSATTEHGEERVLCNVHHWVLH